jgi:neutral ceramidase
MPATLVAGSAAFDISPTDSQFLYGYPHVQRYSTGIHDPLMASALYLSDGAQRVLFIANDIVFIPKDLTRRARQRIAASTGIPAEHIMITATHTHSGPMTLKNISCEADEVVPPLDRAYVRLLEDGIVAAAEKAYATAGPAQWAFATADSTGIGTNRRDPSGPCDSQVPVLAVRNATNDTYIAVMYVCSMHPTVLHEDSTLVSGDFPGMTRQYLHEQTIGPNCPVLHHIGAAGDQSPRHVTKANTFAEAQRLGDILGRSIEQALGTMRFETEVALHAAQSFVELPLRSFPTPDDAESKLQRTAARLKELRASNAPPTETRTAECDWFGAQETLTLARASTSDRLAQTAATCLPAEIQAIRVGPWTFVAWPGELFVEFALQVKRQHDDAFVITLANGETQGYLVTAEAVAEGGYEASNALFLSPDSGDLLVATTLRMLADHRDG